MLLGLQRGDADLVLSAEDVFSAVPKLAHAAELWRTCYATLEALSRRELKLQYAVARANYCIGRDHQDLAERFGELLLLV